MNNKKIVIVCSNVTMDLSVYKSHYKIGVEQGTISLLKNNLFPDLVCGDFDSITKEEKNYIFSKCKNILQLPEKKDFLDGDFALLEAIKIKNYQSIDFIAQGDRLDMNVTFFGFLNFYSRITILNDKTKAYLLNKGINLVPIDLKYDYISLIAFESAIITIKNMKYQVEKLNLPFLSSRALSNEFIQQYPGEITVHSGKVAIILIKK